MEVVRRAASLMAGWAVFLQVCLAFEQNRSLIWVQTPANGAQTFPYVSRLISIEGDPDDWLLQEEPSWKHLPFVHIGWQFHALSFSHRRQMLVWSEDFHGSVQALMLDGRYVVKVRTGTSAEVNGVAVDWRSNNVYWTDGLYNWVMMAPLRANAHNLVGRIVLQDGLDKPHGLVVHPHYNWLIFSDWGVRPRIERTDLLGRKRQILVDSDILQPRGMTIDMASLHLYWVDSAKGTVESISLRGEDLHRSVERKKDGAYFVGIACFKNYLFITDQAQKEIVTIRTDQPDFSRNFSIRGEVPGAIVMFDRDQQPGSAGRCEGFGCNHLCVEDPLTGPRCLCGDGFDLLQDAKSCTLRRQFTVPAHLYAVGVSICMFPAHVADIDVALMSLTSQCFRNDDRGYLALTFDAKVNLLYFASNVTGTISALPMETEAGGRVVVSGTGTVEGMALDWVAGNLFWTDSSHKHIKTCRTDGSFQHILLAEGVVHPLGIVVHPARGKIYWTDIGQKPSVQPTISCANMDGSQREVLLSGNDTLGQPNHLFLDYHTDRLYWADSVLHRVGVYDLNNGTWDVFYQDNLAKFFGISIYKDYLLWTDTAVNGIRIARLDTQEAVRTIVHPGKGRAADITTFDERMQPDIASPCKKRGECGQLCLPSGAHNYTCFCGLGYTLTTRSRCVAEGYTKDNFLLVSDTTQHNVYQLNVDTGRVVAMTTGTRHQPVGVAYLPDPFHTVVWSDNAAHVISFSSQPGSQYVSCFRLPEDSVVEALAMDAASQLLWYTDSGRSVIGVVALPHHPPGKEAVVISEGLDKPRDIVVMPDEGKVYWSDWGNTNVGKGPSICGARMTGAMDSVQVLVRLNFTAWPSGLALDTQGRALYWADGYHNVIGVYHLDSQTQRVLVQDTSVHFFGLSLMGQYLYFVDTNEAIGRLPVEGGEREDFLAADFNTVYAISAYNSSESTQVGSGICANQSLCNGVGQSVCVPVSTDTYTCLCRHGYRLQGPNCVQVTSTITTLPTTTTVNQAHYVTAATLQAVRRIRGGQEAAANTQGNAGVVATTVVMSVVVVAVATAAVALYIKRRRRYGVPHVRLQPPRPTTTTATTTTTTTTPTTPSSTRTPLTIPVQAIPSRLKVTYSRRHGSENVHVSDGVDNPTIAILDAATTSRGNDGGGGRGGCSVERV